MRIQRCQASSEALSVCTHPMNSFSHFLSALRHGEERAAHPLRGWNRPVRPPVCSFDRCLPAIRRGQARAEFHRLRIGYLFVCRRALQEAHKDGSGFRAGGCAAGDEGRSGAAGNEALRVGPSHRLKRPLRNRFVVRVFFH